MNEEPQRYDINISLLLFLFGFLTFLSIMLIFDGLMSYQTDAIRSVVEIGAGIAGIAFVGYNMRKTQLRLSSLGKRPVGPKVVTTESCVNCNYTNVRPFKEGDYIYGKGDTCPKCNFQDPMIVKAVFLQSPPKRPGQ